MMNQNVSKRLAEIKELALGATLHEPVHQAHVHYLLALVEKQREALEEIAKDWPAKLVPEPGDLGEAERWEKISRARKKMARKALAFDPEAK